MERENAMGKTTVTITCRSHTTDFETEQYVWRNGYRRQSMQSTCRDYCRCWPVLQMLKRWMCSSTIDAYIICII